MCCPLPPLPLPVAGIGGVDVFFPLLLCVGCSRLCLWVVCVLLEDFVLRCLIQFFLQALLPPFPRSCGLLGLMPCSAEDCVCGLMPCSALVVVGVPTFGVAGVTCMLPSVVPYSLLSSVQYLLRVPCLSLAPGCCCVLE